ncbi:MAG: hypothetical protein L6Q98_24255 [Anaerolineae bacterium]|nr:hypothetical protein [Anaerolineae bacterium]NUQ06617.1 hypothetical protein [Anaerolineae bacterium]
MKAPARASSGDRRLFLISLIVFALTAVVAVAFLLTRSAPTAQTPAEQGGGGQSGIPMESGFSDPAERSAALSAAGEILPALDEIAAKVEACDAYREERRTQMNIHIAWIRNPDAIPADILLALGANPIGRLLFGMATYTSIEWRLAERPAESCLLPIGQALNRAMAAVGETPLEEFEG